MFAPVAVILSVAAGTKVTGISAGARHSGFVTEEGELLMCGDNERGQLGVMEKQAAGRPVNVLEAAKVVQVACGEEHTLYLNEEGQVF